ncbi:hypothetical protein CDD83_849 [Cordyceps sp. RAO-2017]|nr:hypothetical protein CDD83_849 [Cordyceps sp. RAO-2017]
MSTLATDVRTRRHRHRSTDMVTIATGVRTWRPSPQKGAYAVIAHSSADAAIMACRLQAHGPHATAELAAPFKPYAELGRARRASYNSSRPRGRLGAAASLVQPLE